MKNRTVKFYGKGYGSTPAEIKVQLDEKTIFEGEVITVDQPTHDHAPADQEVLFTCELPIDLEGKIPMSIIVKTGTVVFAHVLANHAFASMPSTEFYPIINGTDARSEVYINNVPQTPAWENSGTWSWTVESGNTLTYNLNVAAGCI